MSVVEHPFTVIRDTAELYGWTVEYVDYGIGHDSHILERGDSVITVFYRARQAMRGTYSGPRSVTVPAGEGLVPPVVDWVVEQLKTDGATPDTARVAWQEWSGSHWVDRVTGLERYSEASAFDEFIRSQQVVSVRDIRMTA